MHCVPNFLACESFYLNKNIVKVGINPNKNFIATLLIFDVKKLDYIEFDCFFLSTLYYCCEKIYEMISQTEKIKRKRFQINDEVIAHITTKKFKNYVTFKSLDTFEKILFDVCEMREFLRLRNHIHHVMVQLFVNSKNVKEIFDKYIQLCIEKNVNSIEEKYFSSLILNHESFFPLNKSRLVFEINSYFQNEVLDVLHTKRKESKCTKLNEVKEEKEEPNTNNVIDLDQEKIKKVKFYCE